MAITITPHQKGRRDVFGAQTGDSIDVADGGVSAALTGGLYRVKATTASVIRIGADPSDATNGEPLDAGETEARMIPDGFKIACDAG